MKEARHPPPHTNKRAHTVRVHICDILENAKESAVIGSRSAPACGGGGGEQGLRKGHRATFGSDRCVHTLDCNDGFVGARVSNCTL